MFECRVDQSIRLIYDLDEGALRCLYIGPHDEALRYGERLSGVGGAVAIEEVVVLGGAQRREEEYVELSVDHLRDQLGITSAEQGHD